MGFPYLLGPTNPWTIDVAMEPFPTSILKSDGEKSHLSICYYHQDR